MDGSNPGGTPFEDSGRATQKMIFLKHADVILANGMNSVLLSFT
jgi:hypothetical protein